MIKKINIGIFIFASTILCYGASANMQENVEAAELVFDGEIVRVDYKVSELSDGRELPYTFVTYKVNDVMKGRVSEDTVTLRFLGGFVEEQVYMSVSDTPYFQEGERDILFVRDNELQPCPLVKCSEGRFRVVDDKIKNSKGKPVNAEYVARIDENFKFEQESLDYFETGESIGVADFIGYIENKTAKMKGSDEPFKSSDLTEKINDPLMEEVFNASAPPPMDLPEKILDVEELDRMDAEFEKTNNPLVKEIMLMDQKTKQQKHQYNAITPPASANPQVKSIRPSAYSEEAPESSTPSRGWLIPLVSVLLFCGWFFFSRRDG